MSYNVLIGVPYGCPDYVVRGLGDCLKNAISAIAQIRVVSGEEDYLREIRRGKEPYNITIAVDPLGRDSMYVPYLQGIQKKNPDLRIIVVVPMECRGLPCMDELLDLGVFNALFQNDITSANLYKLINSPRQFMDAINYYGLDINARVAENKLVPYGQIVATEQTKENEDEPVTRKVRENVFITRGVAKQFDKRNSEEACNDMFSYMDEDGMGIDHVGTSPTEMMEFPLDEEWVENYKAVINKYYRDRGLADLQAFENGACTEGEFRNLISKKMTELKIPAERQKKVVDAFLKDLTSYGKLDVVLNTRDVSDVKLNSKDSVTVQIKGKWYNTNIKFKSDEEFLFFVNKVCTKNHVAVNVNQTQIVFSDITTNPLYRFRISVSHKSINTNGLTTASIRKIDLQKKLVHELINEEYWTKEEAAFLVNAIRKNKSIIVCGGSGSGKTVGVNCLIEYTPDNIVGLCIQEAEELHSSRKPNIEFQHSIAAKGEGKVSVTLKHLATQGLLKNAKLVIIGEIKGDEAEDFFTAANTGSQSICTIHSPTVFDALPRLADLARGAGYSQEQMLKMLSRSVDYIVNIDHYKVRTIAGVVGWDDEKKDVIYDVYKFNSLEEAV